MAPDGVGRGDLPAAVVRQPGNQHVRQAVARPQPAGAEVVAQRAQGVELPLRDADAVTAQKGVHRVGELPQLLPQQRLGLRLRDAVGVLRGIADAAVADQPVPGPVRIGHGAVALAFFEIVHQRVGAGHVPVGEDPQGGQRQEQQGRQRQGNQSFLHAEFSFSVGAKGWIPSPSVLSRRNASKLLKTARFVLEIVGKRRGGTEATKRPWAGGACALYG